MSSRFEANKSKWQDLYRAAIIETDRALLAERIAQAERAIVLRGHGLFHQPEGSVHERRALDAALNALRALKTYSKGTTAA